MNRCDVCNVNVYESEKSCPLCGKAFDSTFDTEVLYPSYEKIKKDNFALKNIPLFISTVAIVICVYINIFTYDSGDVLWSLIVSGGIIFAYSLFRLIPTKKRRYGEKVVLTYVLISITSLAVDFSTGMAFWSTDFVFPFLTMSVILYLTILSIRNKNLFSEYFGYLLTVTAIGFVSIIIYLLGFYNYGWGAFVAIISSFCIALGLYLFADKPLKSEIKKRFYNK